MRRAIFGPAVCTVVALAVLPLSGQPSDASTNHALAGYTCQDHWRNPSGGSWLSGSNWSSGAPPTPRQSACITVGAGASVVLDGTGTARALTIAVPSLAAQLVLFDGTLIVGSLANQGTIITGAGGGTLKAAAGGEVVNDGSVLVPVGTLNVACDLDNGPGGTIAIGGALWLQGPVRLANHGAISLAPNSSFNTLAGLGQGIDNDGGTIANAGTFNVARDDTFVEGAGTTAGNPIKIIGGTVDLKGSGESSFLDNGLIAGNISADQKVDFWSGGGSVDRATGSFTNSGLIGGPASGTLIMPPGSTLTNKGRINEAYWSLYGNLVNLPSGVMYVPGQFEMLRQGSTFTNAGQLYLPAAGALYLNGSPKANAPSDETFVNSGTMYVGVGAGGASWGGFGLHSSILSYSENKTTFGGTVVPLPWGEPKPWQPGNAAKIVYGITAVRSQSYMLACPALVADGWSLQGCGPTLARPGWAVLTDNQATTRVPTEVSVTGSGQAQGNVWTTAYGQPVKLTANVSAQTGRPPTGTVTFLDQVEPVAEDTFVPAVLGTAHLSARGSQATASIVTASLPPESYMLLAIYSGDAAHLPATTDGYSAYLAQQVKPQATTVSLSPLVARAKAGSLVTFTATVAPEVRGAAPPTGEVELINHSNGDVIAEAPVETTSAVSKAVINILPTDATTVIATYTGDYNYGGSSSAAVRVLGHAGP